MLLLFRDLSLSECILDKNDRFRTSDFAHANLINILIYRVKFKMRLIVILSEITVFDSFQFWSKCAANNIIHHNDDDRSVIKFKQAHTL